MNSNLFWQALRDAANEQQISEPALEKLFASVILDRDSLTDALSFLLAQKLQHPYLATEKLYHLFQETAKQDTALPLALKKDLQAVLERDCACSSYLQALCFFKGFHALAGYRFMHQLWLEGKNNLALQLQQRISVVFDVDIHPAAKIGQGVMFDHATGIVIGETASIGNNVSIMQGVTLGGTGKEGGDRHPKIHDGALISVGATILGSILIGEGARIAAGSVVLKPVAPYTTVAGVPARVVGQMANQEPALTMNHKI